METRKNDRGKTHEIKDLLIKIEKQNIEIVEARTFLRAWGKKSNPIKVKCDDGKIYVVKGKKSAGRQIINDQIVARLGSHIDAPVGRPAIVNIPQELIDIQPNHFEDFDAGTAHGTEFVEDCFDSYDLRSIDDNRIRLLTLALLFGWTHANDQQFIYKRPSPYTVYSVDHGHFFPNQPNWRVQDLENDLSAILDPYFNQCHFLADELNIVYDILNNVTEEAIVQAVAFPRYEWGITSEEKLGMINYLKKRKKELQNHLEFKLEVD